MRAEEARAIAKPLLLVNGGLETLLRTSFGDAFRSHDWSQTPLGAVETWSDDLKTAVQILLTELEPAQSPPKPPDDALHQANQLNAFRVKLADALRPLTDATEIQAIAARILGESLGANRVLYTEVVSGGEAVIVHHNYTNGVAQLSGRYRLEDYRRNLTADHQAGYTQVVTEIPNNPNYTDAEQAKYREIEIAAHIDVPLVKNNRFVALLAVHQSMPRQWTETEVKLAEETAERTWAAVERARAEAALRESEAKYRTLFESIDEGFSLVELLFDENDTPVDYRFLEINPAFEQQTGLQHAVGKTVRQLMPDLEDFWLETYGRVALTGEPVRFENYSAPLHRWFDVYACRTGQPADRKVALVFKDISDRKCLEDEGKQAEAIITTDLEHTRLLRDLSARLIAEDNIQVLYDAIVSAAISLTRADAGSIQTLDESAQELVLIATQGIDRTVTDHFQRVNAGSITSCGVVLATGQRVFVDFDVPESEDPDGSLRLHVDAGLLSAQSTPLISRSGRRIGMVSTHWCKHHRPTEQELRFVDLLARQAADLIEQRQTEAERQQSLVREQAARAEAERANRVKDQFLAVLSHELRSPLNPILGWSRLLQNGNLDEAHRTEALKTIERNAKLQTQLIEDLLDISRIMQGKLSLTAAPLSLPFVISAAIETVRLAAEAKQIQLQLDLDPMVAPLAGDVARLQQVVWNLLSNAVKFTPNGGQVTVELRQLKHLAQIRVIDTGKGIKPQFLPYLFEYFRQEDSSTTRQFGGLGLGLAIARQIVELHGGKVWAESQGEGQGATFIVQLPVLSQPTSIIDEPSHPPTAAGLPLEGIQVLLVDDEPDTREFQAFLLEQSGAKVTAVASGLAALQALEQAVPDVLVSDIGMAGMDGYMLLQQIRARSSEQSGMIPALALTAYAAEADQQQALRVGFQAHLTKPVEPEVLVRTLSGLLARS